jgi:hypothetical protein
VPDTRRRWQFGAPFTLIQQIRLVHALAESAFEIAVPVEELDKFAILRERFGLRLAVAAAGDPSLAPFLTIDHATPSTVVGAIARPLIFPRGIADRCRSLWAASRAHRYSFAGLLSDSRRAVLERWLDGHTDPAGGRIRLGGFVRRQVIRWRGADQPRRIGDVTVWSSERGRRFPIKAWDEAYFRMLADSAAVLCPNGDFVWSYRFFEACLCGAVPIVEQASPLYDGFRYRLMSEPRDSRPWSADDAEHNYRVCVERIVVPRAVLDGELERLAALARPVSAAPGRSAPPQS